MLDAHEMRNPTYRPPSEPVPDNDRTPATEDVDNEALVDAWERSKEGQRDDWQMVSAMVQAGNALVAALRAECERARKAEEALRQATALVRRLQEAVEDESVSNWYTDTKASMDAADAFLAARDLKLAHELIEAPSNTEDPTRRA